MQKLEWYEIRVRNGILNLKNLELRPANISVPECTSVEFDRFNIKCPKWDQFIANIIGDQALHPLTATQPRYDQLQLLAGMTLLGIQVPYFFIIKGDLYTGKTTWMKTISNILGTYAQFQENANVSSLRSNAVRLIWTNNCFTPEAKQLISGDKVVVHSIYDQSFSFTPEAKVFQEMNTSLIDETYKDRVITFHFKEKLKSCSPSLRQDLVEEYPAIFNWMIGGARRIITYRQYNTSWDELLQEMKSWEEMIGAK